MPKFLPCIICGGEITEAADCQNTDEGFTHQPYGATTFKTRGHYGSTFWDSFENEWCVIAAHDDCLRKYPERMTFIRLKSVRREMWEEFDPKTGESK